MDEIIDLLSQLSSSSFQRSGETSELDGVLQHNLNTVVNSDTLKKALINGNFYINRNCRWTYVQLCLDLVLALKSKMNNLTEKDKLLSVKQRKAMSCTIELIISFGLLPYLLPGVGISLEQRSKCADYIIQKENINSLQKYKRLCYVVNKLLDLMDVEEFRELILPNHTIDILAALCQLSFAPLIKPTSEKKIDFIMTHEIYNKLISERQQFIIQLHKILENPFQHIVIKNLMLLQSNKENPKWLERCIRRLFSERLMMDNGVCATIKAMCDAGCDENSPKQWAQFEVIAKLIVNSHTNDSYLSHVMPQISKLLKVNDERQSIYRNISIICVKRLYESNESLAYKYILNDMLDPIRRQSVMYKEDEINTSVSMIYALYSFGSDNWSLDSKIFVEITGILLKIYHKMTINNIKQSISRILVKLLSTIDCFCYLLSVLIEERNNVKATHEGIVFIEDNDELCDYTDSLIRLIIDEEGICKNLFLYLLKEYTSIHDKNKKSIKVLKLIDSFVQDDKIREYLLKDMNAIIPFLNIIKNKIPEISTFIEETSKILTCNENTINNEYEQAMFDACDSLIPIRAAALQTLIKLINRNDENALRNSQVLLCLFKETLENDDSFLYLRAIQGIASLAAFKPNDVLSLLCHEYSRGNNTETRLKIGETLVKTVKVLGDAVTNHKAELVNCFLNSTRDDDYLVRVSALSNLAELSLILNCKLGPILMEILNCSKYIIEWDKSQEARRAAVFAIRMILQGLSTDMIQMFGNELSHTYRLLNQLYYEDKDDTVKLHAQLSLEQMSTNISQRLEIELPKEFNEINNLK